MELAVVIGHGRLLGMAEAGDNGYHPDEPGMGHEKGRGDILAQAYGHVDGGEPQVAGHSVQDAAYARVLLGHARQLAVGTVESVGPDQQQHAYRVNPQLVGVEGDAGANAQEDRGDGDDVGSHAQTARQTGPGIAQGTVEGKVNVLLRVRRLQRVAVGDLLLLYFFFNCISHGNHKSGSPCLPDV